MPLRLKSLELHGYKTFATRTFFEFAPGITAIVGPNGAGKSNVADALRWVLGEQSYTLLRGKKTEDMIFSGSEHRPRAGMASAEVSFDNSDKWLPVDYTEVAMTRRAYRDGHNDYLLNSQHVRLRDMNELLAAAGLSERTYTMVGQGLVDASLALKADERRRLFEEAAGVGLYRVRREEAMKRLETTLHNLERVQDIIAEIEPRLKTLERQARRANEYAAAQADLRDVLKEWYGYHWNRAQIDLQQAQENVRSHEGKALAARESLEANQSHHGRLRARIAELRELLGGWHRESAVQHQDRESVSLALAVLDERRRGLETSIEGLRAEMQSISGETVLAAERLKDLEQALNRGEAELAEASDQLNAAQVAFQARQTGRGTIEGRLQEARDRLAGMHASRAEAQARLDALRAQLEYHAARIGTATGALHSSKESAAVADDALRAAMTRRTEIDRRLQELEERVGAAKQNFVNSEAGEREARSKRDSLAANESRLSAQLEVLEQAEQALSGYAEGARFLLEPTRQSRLRVRGALSGLLQLPAELETAVAAALGDAVDAVLLDAGSIDAALEMLDTEDAGRAVMLPLESRSAPDVREPADPDIIGVASRLVQAPPEARAAVDALLGTTIVVRTRSAALRLRRDLPRHARLVTLRGEVFRGDGLISAGRAPASSILSRPRQRRELMDTLRAMSDRLQELESKLADAATNVERATLALQGLEAEHAQLRREVAEREAEEHAAQLEVERQKRLSEWHAARLLEFEQERDAAMSDEPQIESAIAGFKARAVEASDALTQLTTELKEQSLDEAQERAAYWTMRRAVAQQAADTGRLRLNEHMATADKLARELAELEARLTQEAGTLQGLEDERTHRVEQARVLQTQTGELLAQIAPAEQELESLQREETALEEVETTAQRGTTSADRILAQFEIDLVRRQEALESLRARIIDDFGLVSFEYAASIEGPVPLPFEGLVEQLLSVAELAPELEDQLNQRRARVRRLGLINPEAARDYEAESTRYSFLSVQVQDLRQAEADLRQVIAELDELTRQEFSRTYAAVDKQFRAIFTRLFGGGSAHLALTDPENLVETGIEIEARLPGRREQGLSLLSGGERSLTAIALVFALLKVSPTPVCVLDEVDAMLDEANVGRFRDLLAELSQQTQFVVITHNRNTVQAADFIYGVTMGRDSTSQIISLRLDEVSEEMLGTNRA